MIKSLGALAGSAGQQVYQTGTFTLTGTGFDVAPTGTARYSRVGNSVTLYVPTIFGTSNANTFTLTGMPAGIRPPNGSGNIPVLIQDNGAFAFGVLSVASTGVITLIPSATGGSTSWTASGQKTISNVSIAYTLA